ncbi:MAG: Rv3235 family protein [Nocardioides sp.]|nr:Rv3235 family protein [Nocardioides sp.]
MPRQHVRQVRTLSGTVVPLHRPVPVASVQGTLALDVSPRYTPPAFEVADRAPLVGGDQVSAAVRREVEGWAARYAQAAVEIVGGDRPASQLVRWTAGEVYADLQRRAQLVARTGGHQPGVARVQPVRPKVLSVHASFVAPEIAETSLHVRYGQRSRALAARFERRADRWFCTALEFA